MKNTEKTNQRKKAFTFKRLRDAIIVALGGMPNLESNIEELTDSLIGRVKKFQEDMMIRREPELNQVYLFDFKKGWDQARNFDDPRILMPHSGGDADWNINEKGEKEPPKIQIKPIDVLTELETIPKPFNLDNLDDKIKVLKDKAEIIRQVYTKRELEALIERLENRKKYLEHKEFFDKWENTDQEKIDNLLSKYKLVMEDSDLFIPEFPEIAITRMKDYTEQVEEISGKKPIFYVIAEAENFEEKYKKRDPILLAQSPFGFYYQILGAWDKEMILLSEL